MTSHTYARKAYSRLLFAEDINLTSTQRVHIAIAEAHSVRVCAAGKSERGIRAQCHTSRTAVACSSLYLVDLAIAAPAVALNYRVHRQ